MNTYSTPKHRFGPELPTVPNRGCSHFPENSLNEPRNARCYIFGAVHSYGHNLYRTVVIRLENCRLFGQTEPCRSERRPRRASLTPSARLFDRGRGHARPKRIARANNAASEKSACLREGRSARQRASTIAAHVRILTAEADVRIASRAVPCAAE